MKSCSSTHFPEANSLSWQVSGGVFGVSLESGLRTVGNKGNNAVLTMRQCK